MKRAGNLFEPMVSFANLHRAFEDAARGRRRRPAVQEFRVDLERRLFDMREALLVGAWSWGPYRTFLVTDTKPRVIMAAPFPDRVVHHALVNVLDPVLDRSFIDDSFACRTGRGNHAAVQRLRGWIGSAPGAFALRADVRRYFQSIRHDVLLDILARKVKDRRVHGLVASLLAATPVDPELGPGCGIPIGNLTSQLFANVYLSPLDWHAKQALRMRRYVRYVDDIVAMDDDKRRLHDAAAAMQAFLAEHLSLSFHPRKTTVAPVRRGVPFLGFVVFPRQVRVRRDAVRRFRRRERALRASVWRRQIAPERYWNAIDSWLAHAAHSHARGLALGMGFRIPVREGGMGNGSVRPRSRPRVSAAGTGTKSRLSAFDVRLSEEQEHRSVRCRGFRQRACRSRVHAQRERRGVCTLRQPALPKAESRKPKAESAGRRLVGATSPERRRPEFPAAVRPAPPPCTHVPS